MRKALVAAFAVVALGAGSASAVDQQTKDAIKGTAGRYGDAGCGLGSMAFGNQQGIIQVLAATTNGFFGTQTFGITSGTSNCGASGGAVATKVFVEANREALAKDVSRGSGETIATLSNMLGCQDAKAVGATLQKNFTAVFPNETVSSEQVTTTILDTLKRDKMAACSNIG